MSPTPIWPMLPLGSGVWIEARFTKNVMLVFYRIRASYPSPRMIVLPTSGPLPLSETQK
jgi:hypothetical protein